MTDTTGMNPIIQFKRDNNYSWDDLRRMVGMSKNGLIAISHLQPSGVGHVRLKTIHRLKETIGIDLWEYYKQPLRA